MIRIFRKIRTGEITALTNGPERDVRLVITPAELFSEISEPAGPCDPRTVDHYELTGMQENDHGVAMLTLILTDRRRVRFYSTYSQFDMVILLDLLDSTIGERRRAFKPRGSLSRMMQRIISAFCRENWRGKIRSIT